MHPWNEDHSNLLMRRMWRSLIFFSIPAVFCSCGAMEAQGPLKSVLEGKDNTRSPAEQRVFEQHQREMNQQIPPANEDNGAVGFKIPL